MCASVTDKEAAATDFSLYIGLKHTVACSQIVYNDPWSLGQTHLWNLGLSFCQRALLKIVLDEQHSMRSCLVKVKLSYSRSFCAVLCC